MEKWIILIRNPSNGEVMIITEYDYKIDNEKTALFNSEEEALAKAETMSICELWPFRIVKVP